MVDLFKKRFIKLFLLVLFVFSLVGLFLLIKEVQRQQEIRSNASTGSSSQDSQGFVIQYPVSQNSVKSTTYSMTINGQDIPVEKYNSVSYVHFALAGKVNIVIHVNEPLQKYTLSPKSLEIPSTVSGNDITFSLAVPRKLMLWNVNNLSERLIILADPLEDDTPALGNANVFNVLQMGADNTGTTFTTTKIQQAVDSATTLPGGGIVYVPPGIYKTSRIYLKNNVTLYLAPGAVLKASEIPSEHNGTTAILELIDASNVKIMGRGMIDGSGSKLRTNGVKFDMILLRKNVSDVTIRDIILKDSPAANMAIMYSQNVLVDNVKVMVDPNYYNTDGIDFLSSQNITIDNSFIYNSDDALGFGVGFDEAGTLENIVVRNSFLVPGGGVKIGTTLVGLQTVRNVLIENLDILNPTKVLSLFPADGSATIEDIYFNNIRSEKIRKPTEPLFYPGEGFLFQFKVSPATWASNWSGEVGNIKNIHVNNFSAEEFGTANSQFVGFDATHTVDGVTFDNLTINGFSPANPTEAHFSLNSFVKNVQFTKSTPAIVRIISDQSGDYPIFKITRSGDNSNEISIPLTIRGTARNGVDYLQIPQIVTLPAGQSETIIPIKFNTSASGIKSILVSLSNTFPSTYMLGPEYMAAITSFSATTNLETEDGIRSGNVTIENDSTASGGKSIKF